MDCGQSRFLGCLFFNFCLHPPSPLPAPPFTNELFSVIACSFKRRIYELSSLSNLPVPEEKRKNPSDTKEQRENHWQNKMDSTTFKSVLKPKFIGCVASHVKGQLCIIMYPFQTKICRLHVLLNCMYADAFVFTQRKEKKRKETKNNHTSTEIQLCLREVFCCS